MCDEFENSVAEFISTLPIDQHLSWASLDEKSIEQKLSELVQAISADLEVECRLARDSYGSGYASFRDAFFFREHVPFAKHNHTSFFRRFVHRLSIRRRPVYKHYTGLVVVLCKKAPVYCFFEGEKTWGGKISSSYLPAFENVDAIKSDAVKNLSVKMEAYLKGNGYVRLGKNELSGPAPEGLIVNTNLSDPPFHTFDLLFHWED